MTTFLLLRHAHSEANSAGILAGQMEGISLSKSGWLQAEALAAALKELRIDRIISSPMQRCLESANALARSRKKRINLDKRLIEMNYGTWSGEKLKHLSKKYEWKQIQSRPDSFRFPQGESFRELEKRLEAILKELSRKYPKEHILLITHGDVIKIATALTVGSELNNFQRFVVDPCSLTTMVWEPKNRSLISFNLKIVAVGKRKKRRRFSGSTLGGSKDVH